MSDEWNFTDRCMKPYADGDIWQCWLPRGHDKDCKEANREHRANRLSAEQKIKSLRKHIEDLIEELESGIFSGKEVTNSSLVVDRLREWLEELNS